MILVCIFDRSSGYCIESYFAEAVWQLVGMSQWALEFTEQLMRQCILLNAASASESLSESKMDVQSDGDDLFGSAPSQYFMLSLFSLAMRLTSR
jgi:hypothetical protein